MYCYSITKGTCPVIRQNKAVHILKHKGFSKMKIIQELQEFLNKKYKMAGKIQVVFCYTFGLIIITNTIRCICNT